MKKGEAMPHPCFQIIKVDFSMKKGEAMPHPCFQILRTIIACQESSLISFFWWMALLSGTNTISSF